MGEDDAAAPRGHDLAVLAAAALVLALGVLLAAWRPGPGPAPAAIRGGVAIAADRDTYAAYMSSTVGIGLSAVNLTAKTSGPLRYRWTTDYGLFLRWGPPDFKVVPLGNETVNDGGKVYWSYDPGEAQAPKPPVHVSLRVEDAATGRVVAEAGLDIGWGEPWEARVGGR